jgi:hypothetical protein
MASCNPRSSLPFSASLLLAAAAGLANASCAMLPARQIEGTPAQPPRTWEMLGQGARCDLEVDPESPRSVSTECYEFDGKLYVHSQRRAWTSPLWGGDWAAAVERDPDVRLGVYGELYDLRAQLVTDASLRERVLESRGFRPVPDGIELFALQPRRDR